MNAWWTKMILFSVFCVLLSLEFGVATPQGNRLKESYIQNENNNEINIERNVGEKSKQIKMPNNRNEVIPQERILMHNENYGKNIAKNPAAFRNVNEQSNVISERKENNHITPERNINNLHDGSPSSSYIGSVPQVHQYQTFRPKDGVNNGANIPKMGDILSEVNNPNNDFSKIESNPPITREKNPSNQVINTYNRQYSQVPENLSDKEKKEEGGTLFDVPVATPEYIQSLLNEDKQTQNSNVKSMTNLPRNYLNNKSFEPSSQNVNEATSQNPSAEILYEIGHAKPYEITNEQLFNSRHGNKHAPNILQDKQRLKNLYLSSKPTKHYMIVYPDGRVEEVDKLDKIKKMHPNYVMLNAKELLQQGEVDRKVSTGSQGSIVKQNVNTTATVKPQSNSIKDTKDDQMDKVPQKVDKQSLPVPIESFTVATEGNINSMSEVITKTNHVAITSKDEVKLNTHNNIQKQLQENGINDNQDKNKLNNNENNNENTNWVSILTTSNISNIPVIERKNIEDTATTVRSTKSIATEDSDILNQNISNSPALSNNTDKPEPEPKEQPNNNSTSSINLINTDYEKVVDDTSNSSAVLDSYRDGSSTKLNNDTVITFEDGKDSDGNTETIITKSNYESNAQNLESNNITSSDDIMMFVRTSNKSDIANSSSDDLQENMQPLNVNSSNSLTNNTLDIQEKDENHVNTTIIQNVTNVTNSEVDGSKNDDNNFKPNSSDVFSDSTYMNGSFYYTPDETYDVSNAQDESNSNKIFSANIKQEGSKYSDYDDSESIPVGSPDVSNKEDSKTATDASNNNNVISQDGAVPSNSEDTIATSPDTSSDLYYLNSPEKQVIEDDDEEDIDDEDSSKNETANANDNWEKESPSNDGNGVNETSFWFNANDSFWNKLMNSNEHNSFYFLFPRPKPNSKETKKTIYPNGTIVIETTEDDDDGEITSLKKVLTCGNFTICEKKL